MGTFLSNQERAEPWQWEPGELPGTRTLGQWEQRNIGAQGCENGEISGTAAVEDEL